MDKINGILDSDRVLFGLPEQAELDELLLMIRTDCFRNRRRVHEDAPRRASCAQEVLSIDARVNAWSDPIMPIEVDAE
jgi:hypothetical protein